MFVGAESLDSTLGASILSSACSRTVKAQLMIPGSLLMLTAEQEQKQDQEKNESLDSAVFLGLPWGPSVTVRGEVFVLILLCLLGKSAKKKASR